MKEILIIREQEQIERTLVRLYQDAKFDIFRMIKGVARGLFRPMQPSDFKNAFLSISKEQGERLEDLILKNNLKNIIEFGTSFGISTLFLARGVMETGGHIITTELLESKALQAIENFNRAGVTDLIEVRIGDALKTLKNHTDAIDLLLLDGWKDLYLPLFQMLEPNFHANTFIYVDNAEMAASRAFLKTVGQIKRYQLQSMFHGKVVLITIKQ